MMRLCVGRDMAFLVARPQKQYSACPSYSAPCLYSSRWAMPITCNSVIPGRISPRMTSMAFSLMVKACLISSISFALFSMRRLINVSSALTSSTPARSL